MSDGNDRDSGTPADGVPADEPTASSSDGGDGQADVSHDDSARPAPEAETDTAESDTAESDTADSGESAADAVWPVWGGASAHSAASTTDEPADDADAADEPAKEPDADAHPADDAGVPADQQVAHTPADESTDEPATTEVSAEDEQPASTASVPVGDDDGGEGSASDDTTRVMAPVVASAATASEHADASPGAEPDEQPTDEPDDQPDDQPEDPASAADESAGDEPTTVDGADEISAGETASDVPAADVPADEAAPETAATELIPPVATAAAAQRAASVPVRTSTRQPQTDGAEPAEAASSQDAGTPAPAAATAGAAAAAAAAAAATAAGPGTPPDAAPAQAEVPVRHRVTPGDTAVPAPTPTKVTAGPVPATPRKESPLDVFEADDGKRRWPRRLAVVGGIVVVLVGGYVAASYALGDKVPRGATVAGVDIGGLSSSDAVTRLDDELGDATTKKIPVVAQEVTASLDPKDAGLTFDAQATVDQVTGVDLLDPARLWDNVVGTGEVDAVTSVDTKALARSVDALSPALSKTPVDGTVVFVDGSAQATKATDGWKLDTVKASKVVADDWLVGARPLELPTSAVAPDITQDETDAALATAEKVVSAPVSVTVDGKLTVLTADDLSAAASMVPKDGDLVLQMDGEKLTKEILDQQPDLETKASDATFVFVDDKPKIKAGKPGETLDPDDVAAAVSKAAVADERDATVELTKSDPAESTAELKKLGVDEIVSEFSTPLTAEPKRTQNIRVGLEHITGTLVRPGETFSLTEALGPVDAKHGFIDAGAIVSGEHTQAVGGGLSQVSTTTYNAAFFAGMEDITHQPHSEWFSRYPEGRESTIFTGVIDMAWKNTTPYGALVQGWVADGRAYVRIWGTKYWTVKTTTSARSGVVAPTTVYSESKTCEPSLPGNPGFSVTVTRKIYLKDELKKTESNSWRYKPQNRVVCGAPPSSSDDKDDDSGGTDD